MRVQRALPHTLEVSRLHFRDTRIALWMYCLCYIEVWWFGQTTFSFPDLFIYLKKRYKVNTTRNFDYPDKQKRLFVIRMVRKKKQEKC